LVEVCLEQNVVTQMLGGSRGATAGMVFSWREVSVTHLYSGHNQQTTSCSCL
jgi:hypothetical protein